MVIENIKCTKYLKYIVIPVLLFAFKVNAAPVDLIAYAEEWQPYNYTKDKQIVGISADILRLTCTQAKIDCSIQIVPWLRAYKTVQETPDTLILTVARLISREADFVWIGPILPRTTWLYVKTEIADNTQTLQDLANLRIGVNRGAAAIDNLIEMGVPSGSLKIFNSNKDLMRNFKLGTIDVIVNTEIGISHDLRTFNIAPENIRKVHKLYDSGEFYFGMSSNSNPELVKKLKDSLEQLRNEGKIKAIVQQYSKIN